MSESNENGTSKFDTAVYSLWFGLNYGSILTAFALYKALEQYGLHPALLQKQPELWTDHYADKNNLAGLFIYEHCRVLEIFDNEKDMNILKENVKNHVVGSDIVWNYDVIGKQSDLFYFLANVPQGKKKLAYASCFGGDFTAEGGLRNECGKLLRQFNNIAVRESKEAELLYDLCGIDPQTVMDPVFLCDKELYIKCAENSHAKNADGGKTFIFSYVECCDKRKREFLLKGNDILSAKKYNALRNFIDINRYQESKDMLGLEPAFHIKVEDWLYYLINSEFVITDTYYGMLFALIFEKPFVVMANRDLPDLYRYYDILRPLGLEERVVILQSDLKKKEYLFRKPVKYHNANKILNEMRSASEAWLKAQLGIKSKEEGVLEEI